jgi:hypothetical protein
MSKVHCNSDRGKLEIVSVLYIREQSHRLVECKVMANKASANLYVFVGRFSKTLSHRITCRVQSQLCRKCSRRKSRWTKKWVWKGTYGNWASFNGYLMFSFKWKNIVFLNVSQGTNEWITYIFFIRIVSIQFWCVIVPEFDFLTDTVLISWKQPSHQV